MQQLAQALKLPIKAPSNDLRVMVEEKLRVIERDPLNTQVVVDLQEEGTKNLSLQDEEGQLLHIVPPVLSPGSCEPKLHVSSTHGVGPPWSSQEETEEVEPQQPLSEDSGLVHREPLTSIANDKKLARSSQEQAKAEELPQILAVVPELVQEGPVTSIASDKALTELEVNYAKLQEQLHCVSKENGLLKQCLEQKDQELRVLESVINQDKALLEEVNC